MQHWFTYPTNVDPIAIHLGSFGIHWYGISYLIGFVAVGLWMARPAGRKRLGLTADQIQDFLFYALIGVLVGGRLFFVFNDILSHHSGLNETGPILVGQNFMSYVTHPINIIAVWQGGMAFHGGLVGVIVACVLFIKKHPGLKFSVLGDEVVMLLPIGIALTRVVNFINNELWGNVCNPDHPWCMIPKMDGQWGLFYRHPVQIYEALMDIAVLPIVFLLYKRKPADGVVAWTWFTLYGITRSIAEAFRHADFVVPGTPITGGQLYAIPMIVIGIIMVVVCARKGIHTEATVPPVPVAAATTDAP
jgi:phosphatidylglycerol:prolipoprotein diacylglycerol transferase